MIRNVRIALFTVLLTIICCGTVNAYSRGPADIIDSPSTGVFDVGTWEGEARFSTGWSEWSTAVPNATKYARATIYVSAINWVDRGYTPDSSRRPAHNTVCGPNDSSCKVVNQYKTEYNVCTRWDTHYSCNRTSGHGGCDGNECGSCSIDYNNPTGTCTGTYLGTFQWCASALDCRKPGMKPCYWLWNGDETSYTECGASENRYYWSETYTFANPNEKSNWRKSLSEAGDFAKQVYIYSYPQRVYINYDSMGADGLCTAWNKSSNNNYNANENILYVGGNPVCNSKTTGYMSQSYVNYYQNDTSDSGRKYNLSENQYMKTGYDFKGWVLDRSCLNSDGTLAKTCAVYDDKQTITNTPGDSPNGLRAKAGDTVILYAVWQKHDYEITFMYWCGKNPNKLTYKYQTGLTLQNIIVNDSDDKHFACNTPEKSYTNGSGATTYFDGWYENYDPNTGKYSSKISVIPGNYWRDITLYGRMHQIRMFDYSKEKWIWQ